MFLRWKKWLLIVTSAITFDGNTKQIVEQASLGHVVVNISANEQNRLSVSGRRIIHVVPSQKGIISVIKDEAHGALYFKLIAGSAYRGTLTLFVSDDQGETYRIILTPKNIAAEEILIKPPNETKRINRDQAVSYQRQVKNLLLSMTNKEYLDGIEVKLVNRRLPLWKESELTLLAQYVENRLVGEKYSLTNISPSKMIMVEQEFYRPTVRAVVIDQYQLSPGETTEIFIVRERRVDE